jgi:hypothetical protein
LSKKQGDPNFFDKKMSFEINVLNKVNLICE